MAKDEDETTAEYWRRVWAEDPTVSSGYGRDTPEQQKKNHPAGKGR